MRQNDRPELNHARPLETIYNGHRFRSRLEARWAVVFDALGVKANYEPQGFDLDGKPYLPDFYLTERHIWVEVKPNVRTADLSKPLALARHTQEPVVVLDEIPQEHSKGPHHLLIGYDRAANLTVQWFTWLRVDMENGGVLEEPHGFPRIVRDEDEMPDMWTAPFSQVVIRPVVAAAYREARMARFEHGETSRVRVLSTYEFDDLWGTA